MKRKIILLGVTVLLWMASVLPAGASAGTGDVEFTSSGNLVTSNIGTVGTAFHTMAPGETRSISFELSNSNSNTANFYVDAESLQELTAGAESAGAAYDIVVSVSKGGSNTTIYNSSVGGSSDYGVTNNAGLTGIQALGESVYLTTLAGGETAMMNFALTLDGVTNNSYQLSTGDFNFLFSVAYDQVGNSTVDKVVVTQGAVTNKIVKQMNDVVVAVKTGDPAAIGVMIILFFIGVGLLLIAGKKSDRREHYETAKK